MEKERLGLLKRIGYGFAELGNSGAEVMLRISLLIFYTNEVGLRSDYASYALAIGIFWDAITDPLMGRLSDRAKIGGQRRRPFFIPGALGLAFFLVLIFNVPVFESQFSKFLYLLLTYLGTNTFMTVLSVPHTALAGDIGKTPQLRMELFGWRLIFVNLGLILGTAIPALVLSLQFDSLATDSIASFILAGVILLSAFVSYFSTSSLDKVEIKSIKSESLSEYFAHLFEILSHKKFLWLVIAYTVATVGLTLNSSLALYYYKYFLKLEDLDMRIILVFFMTIFCLSIPLWVFLARLWSKEKILLINITLLGLMICICYPLFPERQMTGPMIAGFFGGIFVGAIVLMDVMVADLADRGVENFSEDTLIGSYFGFWKMASKLSRALALVLTGHTLRWIGFQASEAPSEETSGYLSLLFGPGVGGFILLSVLIIAIKIRKETYAS